MNRDKILAMAKEAWKDRTAHEVWFRDAAPAFEAFAALVLAENEERIMAAADVYQGHYMGSSEGNTEELNAAARTALLAAIRGEV